MVTHCSTEPTLRSLTRGERTGSRVFFVLWSYVEVEDGTYVYNASCVTAPAYKIAYCFSNSQCEHAI